MSMPTFQRSIPDQIYRLEMRLETNMVNRKTWLERREWPSRLTRMPSLMSALRIILLEVGDRSACLAI